MTGSQPFTLRHSICVDRFMCSKIQETKPQPWKCTQREPSCKSGKSESILIGNLSNLYAKAGVDHYLWDFIIGNAFLAG